MIVRVIQNFKLMDPPVGLKPRMYEIGQTVSLVAESARVLISGGLAEEVEEQVKVVTKKSFRRKVKAKPARSSE